MKPNRRRDTNPHRSVVEYVDRDSVLTAYYNSQEGGGYYGAVVDHAIHGLRRYHMFAGWQHNTEKFARVVVPAFRPRTP